MKKTLCLLLIAFPLSIIAQQAKTAKEILAAAYTEAEEQHKNVFVIFHASWCGWCKKMDASMNDSLCKKMFDDHYVIVHLTIKENKRHKKEENPGALEILKKLNAADTGIPFWLIYNSKKELLTTSFIKSANNKKHNIGCPASEKEVDAFIAILQQTSSLGEKEFDIIRTVFRKNESD